MGDLYKTLLELYFPIMLFVYPILGILSLYSTIDERSQLKKTLIFTILNLFHILL